jgi:hypothetical protein
LAPKDRPKTGLGLMISHEHNQLIESGPFSYGLNIWGLILAEP